MSSPRSVILLRVSLVGSAMKINPDVQHLFLAGKFQQATQQV
jgi:hypothetical protein